MARTRRAVSIIEELAELIAAQPTRRQLLDYHPSNSIQKRARELLWKMKESTISYEEEQELDEFEMAERLMRLVKAMLRTEKAAR